MTIMFWVFASCVTTGCACGLFVLRIWWRFAGGLALAVYTWSVVLSLIASH